MQTCRTETDKANKLLELLDRRDDAMFTMFCEALYETGQKNIVEDILRPNLAASSTAGQSIDDLMSHRMDDGLLEIGLLQL